MLFSMDMVGQVDVIRHYGYTLSMYSIQVGIFQESSQIVFSSLLQCLDHAHLEMQNHADQAHKGLLMDEELSTLLVLMY